MNMMKPVGLLLAATLISAPVVAQTPEERGLEIATEAKHRDLGWDDMKANMLMILRNKQGETSIREIRMKSLEQENDGDKSLTVFDKPRDVKGTAFLSFSHPVGADDQWLYLPALKRVKRISSRNKSGPFMVLSLLMKICLHSRLRNTPISISTMRPVPSVSVLWLNSTRLISIPATPAVSSGWIMMNTGPGKSSSMTVRTAC